MLKGAIDLLLSLSPTIISILGIYFALNQFKLERKSNETYGSVNSILQKLIDLKLYIEVKIDDMNFYDNKLQAAELDDKDIKDMIDISQLNNVSKVRRFINRS